MERLPKVALPAIIAAIVLIILLAKSAVTIGSGEAGVLYKTFDNGVVTDQPPLGEGFQKERELMEKPDKELFEKMKVLSSNGLEIQIDASAWYEPVYNNLGKLHQTLGENYLQRVIQPAIRSAARSVVGRYTPEQLYSSKRDAIQDEIFEETKKILSKQHVQLNEVLVRDVTLPNTIKDAIERKLKQEQESLEYEFRLVTAAKEAEKVIIEAEGKAESNRILSASLTDKILQDKGIDATMRLAESPNSKIIVIGSGDSGLPIILGNQ